MRILTTTYVQEQLEEQLSGFRRALASLEARLDQEVKERRNASSMHQLQYHHHHHHGAVNHNATLDDAASAMSSSSGPEDLSQSQSGVCNFRDLSINLSISFCENISTR